MFQPSRARARLALALFTLSAVCAIPCSNAGAGTPSIGFHFVGAGGKALTNACFRLSGTVGQTAPGYSSSASQSIVAGFWTAAPTANLDEIFFNSFEDC